MAAGRRVQNAKQQTRRISCHVAEIMQHHYCFGQRVASDKKQETTLSERIIPKHTIKIPQQGNERIKQQQKNNNDQFGLLKLILYAKMSHGGGCRSLFDESIYPVIRKNSGLVNKMKWYTHLQSNTHIDDTTGMCCGVLHLSCYAGCAHRHDPKSKQSVFIIVACAGICIVEYVVCICVCTMCVF